MKKSRIALAVAALFFGAHVGFAALESGSAGAPETATAQAAEDAAEQHAADYQAATAEIADRTESSVAAQPEAAETAEAAGAETTVAAAQAAEAVAPAPAATQAEAAPQQPVAATATPEQPATWWDKLTAAIASFFEQVRVVFASATPAPTFPDGDGSRAWHLPATIAYLDRVEQERAAAAQAATSPALAAADGKARTVTQAAATDSAFPMGADESTWREPMPAELAYYEQLERERLAQETGIQTAQANTAAIR